MNLRRLKFLLNRRALSRVRVDRALFTARRDQLTREQAREAYAALKAEIAALQDEARPAILALEDPLERQALEMRYLRGLSVREIAYRLHYSEQHIFRVVRRGESRLESHESRRAGTLAKRSDAHG